MLVVTVREKKQEYQVPSYYDSELARDPAIAKMKSLSSWLLYDPVIERNCERFQFIFYMEGLVSPDQRRHGDRSR